MTAKELFDKLKTWFKDTCVQKRVSNEEEGYGWVAEDLEYEEELGTKEFQDFFDRKDLNSEYTQNYEEEEAKNKKSYAWQQNEINLIYSFHKSFALRNRSRLQFYRDDLSSKGARVLSSMYIGLGKLEYKKEHEEDDK